METLNASLLQEIQNIVKELQLIVTKENFSIGCYINDHGITVHIIKYIASSTDMSKPTKVETLFEDRKKFDDNYELVYSVITSKNV